MTLTEKYKQALEHRAGEKRLDMEERLRGQEEIYYDESRPKDEREEAKACMTSLEAAILGFDKAMQVLWDVEVPITVEGDLEIIKKDTKNIVVECGRWVMGDFDPSEDEFDGYSDTYEITPGLGDGVYTVTEKRARLPFWGERVIGVEVEFISEESVRAILKAEAEREG